MIFHPEPQYLYSRDTIQKKTENQWQINYLAHILASKLLRRFWIVSTENLFFYLASFLTTLVLKTIVAPKFNA